MNGGMMKFIFRLVVQRLDHLKDTHQIIFTMDTYGCHIAKDTLRCCGRLGMWPHLIPAKMTWALQPLDTHVFAKFKSKLVTTGQELQIAQSNPSTVHWEVMIQAVVKTAQEILCGESWARAFDHTGVGGDMNLVSQNVLGKIGIRDAPVLAARLPTATELQAILPNSYSDFRIDELFGAWTGRYDRQEVDADRRGVWRGRLRSSSAMARAPAAEAEAREPEPRRVQVGRPLWVRVRLPL